jgi:chaperonin cofactor prefoldin
MKLKYDAYTINGGYKLIVTVEDKSPLETDKIFIHESSSDKFIKVATLSELYLVPDTRYTDKYYRKNFVDILKTTIIEADSIRKLINDQANTLAIEANTIQQFYSNETTIEYPIQNLSTSEVEKLYSQYLSIKEERDSYISQRDQLKATRDAIDNTLKYIQGVFEPILIADPSTFNTEDYADILYSISTIKSAKKQIETAIGNIEYIVNTSKLSDLADEINGYIESNQSSIDSDRLNGRTNTMSYSSLRSVNNFLRPIPAILKTADMKAKTVVDLVKTAAQTIINVSDPEHPTYINSISDELLGKAEAETSALLSKLSSLSSQVTTAVNLVHIVIAKYNKDIKDLDSQILSLNNKIDISNRALEELKSEILDKDPNFNLSLF